MEKKVIILDFDGTVYSGDDIFCYVSEYIEKYRRSFFPNISNEDYEMILRENPDFLSATIGSQIVKFIYYFKDKYPTLSISIKGFTDCQDENIYDINFRKAQFVDVDFITQLCKDYPVYIVSNSSIKHIKHYMKVIGIDPNIFKEIYSNRFEEFDRTKQHYYKDIIDKERISSQNLFVFGDSQNSDLNPAINLGANTFLSQNAKDLDSLIISALK